MRQGGYIIDHTVPLLKKIPLNSFILVPPIKFSLCSFIFYALPTTIKPGIICLEFAEMQELHYFLPANCISLIVRSYT